ncbi:MAG: gamma-glutamyl-gamma-aminobutyrate hydrolase family protein [Prolixibacteraceae bacterium]|jgi:GMP synthase (glutamine-hydrolysing)|nr:gamma-glutamyl-gamma-aminobutyrate hydrolase family protein [Prolixibacteraceae bacterium]
MKNILIIKCGTTFKNIKKENADFEDWIIKRSNLPDRVFKVFNLPNGDQLRHPSEYIGAIITGSHYNVNQKHEWLKSLKDWIVTAFYSNIPVLGICFGHQVIAEALGGKVEQDKWGGHTGIGNISITDEGQSDSLFKNIGKRLEAYKSHEYSVSELPLNAELLAIDEQNNRIEAFRAGKIYGVQFHPEFNWQIMKAYIEENEGTPPSRKRYKMKLEGKSEQIIPNFLDFVLKF